MKGKKSSLHFTGRRHSRGGIISTVMAGIAWILFAALCVYSSATGGDATIVAGILGILDALFVLVGMIIAFRSLHERDVYYVLPVVGMVLNGILFIIYFSLYFMGIAIA